MFLFANVLLVFSIIRLCFLLWPLAGSDPKMSLLKSDEVVSS